MNRAPARNPVHIGHVLQNAAVFDFKNWRGDASTLTPGMESLLQTVAELFNLLRARRVDYTLVGGIALLQYVEGRNTEDIDLIVALSELERLPEIKISSQDEDFARGRFKGLQIDFLLTRNPLFDKVKRDYANTQQFVEQVIPCATVEGLLLLKLFALPALYRLGNFARVGLYEGDIATLIHDYQPDLTALFSELSQHLSATDLQSVREIVNEIEQRIERFRKGSIDRSA